MEEISVILIIKGGINDMAPGGATILKLFFIVKKLQNLK